MEVYISSNAFWALLISAIEVYKRECFGLLLGYRDHPNSYIVEHAISYQTANRRHTSVEKNGRASRRIEKFLANLPHLSLVGDFHSHSCQLERVCLAGRFGRKMSHEKNIFSHLDHLCIRADPLVSGGRQRGLWPFRAADLRGDDGQSLRRRAEGIGPRLLH